MSEDNRPKVCCDMIIERKGKLLMGKRGNVFGKGTWALVGGHLEKGETTLDCVKRELAEETGITPTQVNLLGIVNDIPNTPGQVNHYIRFVYKITGFNGEVENKEPDKCEGWQWFDKDNLPSPLFVGHIKVIDYYLNKKEGFLTEV